MARPTPRVNTRNAKAPLSTLRIIGGQWRGRKISFPAVDGLRPTPDRVRETLFNWLQPHIAGARCLDLYSGSGALGLEALSRGAASCAFVDRDSQVVRQIGENLKLLDSGDGELIHASADQWLSLQNGALRKPFDIVFMDPPFNQGKVAGDCAALVSAGLLAENAIVYIETESRLSDPGTPASWHEHRQKKAGRVSYRLFYTDRN